MNLSPLLLTLCGAASLLGTACMVTPQNGDLLPAKNASVEIGGFALVVQPIEVMALNRQTFQWDTFTTITPDASKFATDSQNIVWYPWDSHVVLPQAAAYWSFNAQGQPSIQIKAGGPHDAPGNSPANALASFDTGSIDCIMNTAVATASGMQIISNCASGMKPVVELHTPCGAGSQVCCANNSCNSGFACRFGNCRAVAPSQGTGGSGGSGGAPADPCAGAGTACAIHPTDCSQPGFMASGTYQCKSGKLVCVARAGFDYCNVCGGNCGGCPGNGCGVGSYCNPGAKCVNSQCFVEPVCGRPTGSCWALNEVGSCSAAAAMMPDG